MSEDDRHRPTPIADKFIAEQKILLGIEENPVYTKEKFIRDLRAALNLVEGVRDYSIAEFHSEFGIKLPDPESHPEPEFRSCVPPPIQRHIPQDIKAIDVAEVKQIIFTKERWRRGFTLKTVWRHGDYIIG